MYLIKNKKYLIILYLSTNKEFYDIFTFLLVQG